MAIRVNHRLSRFSALALVMILFGANGGRAQVSNSANAIADANWIMGAVISNGPMTGAIGMYPDPNGLTHIRPYQANLACLGLARAGVISGDPQYLNAVWNHLNWYASHMDANGYVHDWDEVNGAWTQAGYDSTDSYAATFLLAVRAAYRASGDATKVKNLGPGIQVAINAIHATQQSDGMTWSTPAYHVKYLEDQVEAYQGLISGESLAAMLGLTSIAQSAQSYADSMSSGLATLWNPSNNTYYGAKDESGNLTPPDWSILSPDTTEEAWAVSFSVAKGSKAVGLLNGISSYQSDWDQPEDNNYDYDVIPIGWGFYFNGQIDEAHTAAANLRNAAIFANRAWPFTPGDCGSLIILETDGEYLISSFTPRLPLSFHQGL
jgi:hypothetical protein